MKLQLGRHFYGLAAISFGVLTLVRHQIYLLGNISHPEILVYIAGIVELIGGLAIQWERTVKFGALTIAAIFFIFSIYWIPQIVEKPLVYGYWGNFFEQFSIVLGGVIVFASTIQSDQERVAKIARAAYRFYGICVISYTLYQLFYLSDTADLVPTWIPPGQMFWAVTTTILFALAAFAIISGRSALLASRLLTAMIIGFGLLVWLPVCIGDPHELTNWARNATNLAVAGAAWVVADFLYQSKIFPLKWQLGHIPIEEKKD
ncbi:MAG: hypothetical protein M1391_07025 [Bacteroidetes bacterium]|nr:hypothetical protein [Bacteroidota bacterium]